MVIASLLLCLLAIVACSLVIWRGCDSFEEASGYLGRNMPAGVRGATINAIGSSLPELLTTMILLFVFIDEDGYSGGIATCAGSAVFNAVIIPALCIVAVLAFGVVRKGKKLRVSAIEVGRPTILRDGLFFVGAELVLIALLGSAVMYWWMGAILISVYLVYFSYLMFQFRRGSGAAADETDDDDNEDNEPRPILASLLALDFNQLLVAGRCLSTGRAWAVLSAATAVVGAACYVLSYAVVEAAHLLDVPLYFTTVILAAAATSVPDTALSIKDARAGDYDDAVSNALGSNIFDITVALGLPLMLYGLIHGPVHLTATSGSAADVQILRIALLVITTLVLVIFLAGRKMGWGKAVLLLGLFAGWTAFVVGRAAGWI
ncbi:MAG: sodium:calcium antiporter [Myxococcota bacterium]|jgi:cation:H+ antiporter|nr:sodium:calcium antiporter [Myxococcota bacterium]